MSDHTSALTGEQDNLGGPAVVGHTRGPWRLADHSSNTYDIRITSAARYHIATVCEISTKRDIEAELNALLISAAPEMLAALLYYRDECSGAEPSISAFHQKLDYAIAKATGEMA